MRINMAEIGVGLVSGGVFFLALGVIMFFDATLLAMGNVLFVSGIALLIGPQKTLLFFARKQKIRGTVCFFTGMSLVFLRWAIVGVIVETVGFLNLFGYVTFSVCVLVWRLCQLTCSRDFFPVILSFMRQMPIIGNVFSLPVIGQVCYFISNYVCQVLTLSGHGPASRHTALRCIISVNVLAHV